MTVNYLLMDNRIRLEKQNKPNNQVTELILDNCQASHISGLTEEFISLENLSIINVGLVTLKGFPKLPNLKRLELCDNKLSDGLNLLAGCPRLQELSLSGNNFKDLSALETLKGFKDLINLDLFNCEISKFGDYRQKVFDLLPNLQILDGIVRPERISPQSPEPTRIVNEDIVVENVDKTSTEKEDTSMVIDNKDTTCLVENDTPPAEESIFKQVFNVLKDNSLNMAETISMETCTAKEETPMNIEEAPVNNVGCLENEEVKDVSVEIDCANEETSEKEDQSLRIESEDNVCPEEEVAIPASENIECEQQQGELEIEESYEKETTSEDRQDISIAEETDQQDSIIEISADHDSSNEEEYSSEENQQELSIEEEEDLTSSSEGDYDEEGDLEEGEYVDDDDEEGEEDEEELNRTYDLTLDQTFNQTIEVSSQDEGDVSQNDEMQDTSVEEPHEESAQVLQELSGMQETTYSEMEEKSGQVQEGGEEQSSEEVEN